MSIAYGLRQISFLVLWESNSEGQWFSWLCILLHVNVGCATMISEWEPSSGRALQIESASQANPKFAFLDDVAERRLGKKTTSAMHCNYPRYSLITMEVILLTELTFKLGNFWADDVYFTTSLKETMIVRQFLWCCLISHESTCLQ